MPAFALQRNPSIGELVTSLTSSGVATGAAETASRGRVLCLHGFKTSSTVLRQQMAPLARALEGHGYALIVPDGPHVTSGDAQGAAGLDADDSYGWWTYEDDSHDSTPIGLHASTKLLHRLGPSFVGVVGFSQGGAMAAAVADSVGARWALLFSPVYVPQRPAQCSCPTLVAFDPADEVREATKTLLDELPSATLQTLTHADGHRLPPDGAWWESVAAFVKDQVVRGDSAAPSSGAAASDHGV